MHTIYEIKELFENAPKQEWPQLFEAFKNDSRKGVQSTLVYYEKKQKAFAMELERLERISVFEKELYKEGFQFIAGIDEVGRGPLAGPVVTAAVILPRGCKIQGVNDSKKLSESKREALYDEICQKAVAYAFGVVSSETIDEINILQATYKAMKIAAEGLCQTPDCLLVDAVTIPHVAIKQKGIIKGDEKSISIAAASIIAKVTRDRMMVQLHELYPAYDFLHNKGYGAKKHLEAIKKYGPCPIHRRSFLKNIQNG